MEELKMLLSFQRENEYLDIKEKFYEKDKKYDLVKDICSFLNNSVDKDKYIVFGIKDDTWEVVGVDGQPKIEISNVQQLLNQYAEPNVMLDVGELKIDGKTLAFIEIKKDNFDRPYIIKKSASINNRESLREGQIYIRKGATNLIANRKDIDYMYSKKLSFSIRIDGNIKIIKVLDQLKEKWYFSLNIDLVNELERDYVVESVCLKMETDKRILFLDKAIASIYSMSYKDKLVIDKTNPITIYAKSEMNRYLNFFISDDIIKILDEENLKDLKLIFNKQGRNERLFYIEKFKINR